MQYGSPAVARRERVTGLMTWSRSGHHDHNWDDKDWSNWDWRNWR